MRLWPVFIDSVPPYLGSSGVSLLQVPMGADLLVLQLCRRVEVVTSEPPTILAPLGSDVDYQARMKALCPSAVVVTTPDELADVMSAVEVSDALLFVDPRFLPINEAQFKTLVVLSGSRPRVARHLVAFAEAGGTNEHVDVDGQGRVRSVHRYYEPATSPFIAGVAASLVPVSSGILPLESAPTSLLDLRQQLASRGVPSHDVSINSDAFDLATEQGLLAAAERYVRQAAGVARAWEGTSTVLVGDGHVIDATARLLGPIVIQSNARIEANVTIVGPTLIGARSHVSANAVVAHSVLGTQSLVGTGQVLSGRVWFTDEGSAPSDAERASVFTVEPHRNLRRESFDEAPASRYAVFKRMFDCVIAAVSLVFLSPFLLLVAALVRLDSSDGPAFYSDEREGLGGRLFKCHKFRTMRTGASALQRHLKSLGNIDGPHFKLEADPRVTRLGRMLRATNIDELPQLVNVLVGDMSLVGPRPSPFRENQICVPWREGRLSLRPGVTGLWQVCRQDRASGDFHQWIEYDLLYVQHVSLLLDLKILAATIFTFGGRFPVPVSWMVRGAGRAPAAPASSAPSASENIVGPARKGVRAFSAIGRYYDSVRPK
jgi:lipopolysaccharide/colanic/teichoic acid biosynthesis glycosyltransferase